jgi:predicted CXXCH cytochrome family protein
LEAPLYHADGQQRDEVFNHGSFMQSRMHAAGVTCSDCHNPHSGKLRQTGNAVCAQCHASEKFDAPSHHHHAVGTPGAQCASCHMPTTVYMGVDARHDHSMRIPRPDRTHVLGTPNACNQCHTDKPAQWATDAIKSWFHAPKPGAQTFAEAFDLGDRGAPGAQSALIRVVEDASLSGIVRASAIARLGQYPSRQVMDVVARALQVNDPEIRSAAIAAISRAGTAARQALLAPLLKDETRLVRMDAASALAGEAEQGLSPDDRKLFEKALAEYVSAQLFNAERPESHANLGALYLRRGMIEEARAAFKEATEIDPTFVAPAISLADLERAGSDERAGEAILQRSLERNPRSGPLLHALGLNLVRQSRRNEALEKLAEAAKLSPEEPRFTYVYAVAVHGTGKVMEAVDILKTALVRHPYDREILMALISYEIQMQDFRSALRWAELMAQLEPERADVQQLIGRLRRGVR